jgi:hypothetical protein
VVTANLTTSFNQLSACLWTSHANALLCCVNHIQYVTQQILIGVNTVYVTSFYSRLCPVNRIHLNHFCRYHTWLVSALPDLFCMARQHLVALGLLTLEDARSHSDTPQSVGLLRKNEWPIAETSTWQHTTITLETGIHVPLPRAGFEPAIPASKWP